MPNVNVTFSDMNDAASRLRQGQDDLQSKLNELAGYINTLVSDGFVTDHASGAFHDTYTNFTNGANQTVGALEDLAKFLDSAAQAMQETDAQLAQSIGGS